MVMTIMTEKMALPRAILRRRGGGKDKDCGDDRHRDNGVKVKGGKGGETYCQLSGLHVHGSWDATRQQAKCGTR